MNDASMRDYKETLIEALASFRCCRDPDVQTFLNTKAIDFEKRGWASTYLLLNEEKMAKSQLLVEGYFSLTHKAVKFNSEVSKSKRSQITGDKLSSDHSFVLIGQLGKRIVDLGDEKYDESDLTASELLGDALTIIEKSSEYIICRNVILECKPIDKVKNIYVQNGFVELQYDEQDNLHTMYYRMDHSVNF